MRVGIIHCLWEAGWEPADVAGADEALALLEGPAEFDFLLVAHPMPLDLDGIVLARRAATPVAAPDLAAGRPGGTGQFAAQARHEDLRILRKPVSPIELGDALAALMHRYAVRPPVEAAD